MVEAHGRLVTAPGRERVEHVGQGDDPPFHRDPFAPQAVGIPGPVEVLVVRERDRFGHTDQVRVRVPEDVGADDRVALHHLPLVLRERPRLHEDRIRNAELSHVVHRGGVEEQVDLALAPSHVLRDHGRVPAHPLDVVVGVTVPVFGRDRQPQDRVEVGLLDLRRELGILERHGGLGREGENQFLDHAGERDGLPVGVERIDELEDADHLVLRILERHDHERARPVHVLLVEVLVEVIRLRSGDLVGVADVEDLAGRSDVAGQALVGDRNRSVEVRVLRNGAGLALDDRVILRHDETEKALLDDVEAPGVGPREPPRLRDDLLEKNIEIVLACEGDADLDQIGDELFGP